MQLGRKDRKTFSQINYLERARLFDLRVLNPIQQVMCPLPEIRVRRGSGKAIQ